MTHAITHRAVLAGAAAVSALVMLTACGGNDDADGNHGTGASAASSPDGGAEFNDTDIEFAQMMIPHHQQAVEMAALAEARAGDAEIKQIASQVTAAQEAEITTMTGWLTAWGQPTSRPDGEHHMPGTSHRHGEMPEGDMAKLEAATGTEFDRAFAEMMIDHHNGAVQMARDEQAAGRNPEAKALAAEIEKAQTAEVSTLRQILARL